MKDPQHLFKRVIVAIISGGLVLGSLAITMAEGTLSRVYHSAPSPSQSPTQFQLPASQETAEATPISDESATRTPEPTSPPRSNACTPPQGWIRIITNPGDTLDSLAQIYQTTPELLAEANCLLSSKIFPDMYLYVPDTNPTVPPQKCGPPAGWVLYRVQDDDNLFRLSLAFQTTVQKLQMANCLGNSTAIRAGQQIYVPNVPTVVPTITATVTPTTKVTSTPTVATTITSTPTTSPVTSTPSPTYTNTPTSSPIPPTQTNTSTPTSTEDPYPYP